MCMYLWCGEKWHCVVLPPVDKDGRQAEGNVVILVHELMMKLAEQSLFFHTINTLCLQSPKILENSLNMKLVKVCFTAINAPSKSRETDKIISIIQSVYKNYNSMSVIIKY